MNTVHIVVEESLGFGGGGWETGYYIYLIRGGKVFKEIRTSYKEEVLDSVKSMLKEFGIEFKVHKVDYPPKGEDFCKQLLKVICKESGKKSNTEEEGS